MASVRRRQWQHNGETKAAYQVSYLDAYGKRHTKTFDRKKDADLFRIAKESESLISERLGPDAPVREDITFEKAADLFLERCDQRVKIGDLRRITVYDYKGHIKRYLRPGLGKLRLSQLTFGRLQQWIDSLAYDPVKPRRVGTLTPLSLMAYLILKDMKVRGLVRENVLQDNKLNIPGRKNAPTAIPTKDEIRMLLTAARTPGPVKVNSEQKAAYVLVDPSHQQAPTMLPMLFTAIFAGLRLGELRALTWDNIDFDKGLIRVRQGVDRMGNVDAPKTLAGVRDVPLAPPLALELKRWKLACRRTRQGWAFVNRDGRQCTTSGVQKNWLMLQERVFGEGQGRRYHFHALRHVAASLFIESGMPPKRIQAIMGHVSITTTFDLYGHLFEDPALVSAAMQKIGAGLVG